MFNAERISSVTTTYTGSNPNSKGAQVGGDFGESRSLAFLRVCLGAVPVNSRTPTTADGCTGGRTNALEWKFDGDLADSSGKGFTARMSSGRPVYVPTPNQKVLGVIKPPMLRRGTIG